MRDKNPSNKISDYANSKYVVSCFLCMQGNILDKDIYWTHQRLNKKELHSFMTSGEKITQ